MVDTNLNLSNLLGHIVTMLREILQNGYTLNPGLQQSRFLLYIIFRMPPMLSSLF
jgi:hypothetical protein